MSKSRDHLNLSGQGDDFTVLPPKVITNLLRLATDAALSIPELTLKDRYFLTYSNASEAHQYHPELEIIKGSPYNVSKSLDKCCIIDFNIWGSAVISNKSFNLKSSLGLHQYFLPYFLEYIFSDELWCPNGKWPIFHSKLIHLFQDHSLLESSPGTGFYRLNLNAKKLENLGIQGFLAQTTFDLMMPWTFSLTEFNKLEQIIKQEF
jgi:hypothetical protein